MEASVPLMHRISIGNHWLPLGGKEIESHTICGYWTQPSPNHSPVSILLKLPLHSITSRIKEINISQ